MLNRINILSSTCYRNRTTLRNLWLHPYQFSHGCYELNYDSSMKCYTCNTPIISALVSEACTCMYINITYCIKMQMLNCFKAHAFFIDIGPWPNHVTH